MTSAEIVSRAEALYENRIRAQVEARNRGRYIAIDVDSGDYEIGEDRLTLSKLLRAKKPDALISILRIGFPVVGRIGSRNRPVTA